MPNWRAVRREGSHEPADEAVGQSRRRVAFRLVEAPLSPPAPSSWERGLHHMDEIAPVPGRRRGLGERRVCRTRSLSLDSVIPVRNRAGDVDAPNETDLNPRSRCGSPTWGWTGPQRLRRLPGRIAGRHPLTRSAQQQSDENFDGTKFNHCSLRSQAVAVPAGRARGYLSPGQRSRWGASPRRQARGALRAAARLLTKPAQADELRTVGGVRRLLRPG